MDIGIIITDILVVIIGSLIGYIWNKYVLPFLKDKHLQEAARVAVSAAQSLYGSLHGEEKLQYAIEIVNNKYGINMDSEKIEAAIEAAWQQLNLDQISAGVKTTK